MSLEETHCGLIENTQLPPVSLFVSTLHFFRLLLHPTLSLLRAFIISPQFLRRAQHTVLRAFRQRGEAARYVWADSYYFCRSTCQIVNGQWVEVKRTGVLSSSSSISLRSGTCKLVRKGEVENNYGGWEKWVYCLTCNEVESWHSGFVRLANFECEEMTRLYCQPPGGDCQL